MRDWGYAYECEIQEVADELRKARAEARGHSRTGREAVVYVPSKCREVKISQINDYQIREVAQYEAEKYTNRAINMHNERLSNE